MILGLASGSVNRKAVSPMEVLRAGWTLCWFCFCGEKAGTEGANVAGDLGNNIFIHNFSYSLIQCGYIVALVPSNTGKPFLHKRIQEPYRSCVAIRHHSRSLEL